MILVNIVSCFLVILTVDKLCWLLTRNVYSHTTRYISLREHRPLEDIYYIPDDSYMYHADSLIKKAYRLRTDENGFIIPSAVHENPDIVFVFLGGSTTECCYVDEDKRFPFLFGRLVEERTNLKINSYNAGCSGNNTLHMIDILVNKIIPIKPNIGFMMENINDLVILIYENTYWNTAPWRAPIVEVKPSFSSVIRQCASLIFPHITPIVGQYFISHDEWKHLKKGKKSY